jgi:hypothetical protein
MRNGISFCKSWPAEWFSGLAVLSGTSKHAVTSRALFYRPTLRTFSRAAAVVCGLSVWH